MEGEHPRAAVRVPSRLRGNREGRLGAETAETIGELHIRASSARCAFPILQVEEDFLL
jgi:hypothetical protein